MASAWFDLTRIASSAKTTTSSRCHIQSAAGNAAGLQFIYPPGSINVVITSDTTDVQERPQITSASAALFVPLSQFDQCLHPLMYNFDSTFRAPDISAEKVLEVQML